MSKSDSDPEEESLDLFADPPDYYPPSPKPTTETHKLLSGTTLTVRLVGHNPLWGHHLWNAGRIISNYLETNQDLIASRSVLEFGAGAGLPSLVCALLGARTVVVTDYPDQDLIENLCVNIEQCVPKPSDGSARSIVAEGYLWGASPLPLLKHVAPRPAFDVLILADLLFNHSEHGKLIASVQQTLSRTPDATALVFFTPYRPWLLEKDMAFFDLAREAGFSVEKVLEEKMEKVMFEEDRGDEEVRRTVFGYVLRWVDVQGQSASAAA